MDSQNLLGLTKEIPYKWRVQSINDKGATCVAYIDSRQVQDLLDEICGPENWQSDYKEVKGNMFAGIGIYVTNAVKAPGQWIWKWDCGTESNTEKEKGEASDSFKRAAVKWGIGRFLYSLKIVRLYSIQVGSGKYLPMNKATGKPIWTGEELTDYINSNMLK